MTSRGENGVLGVLCTPKALKIIGCVVGVVGSLVVYGILQERIMTRPYGDDGEEEFFKFSVFLVLNNRLLAVCAAACILVAIKGAVRPVAPIYSYATVSASNVVATTCQYEALKYVSFPVQTLGKCAKMIPVLIWGFAINQRRYDAADMLVAAFITAGCTIFALYGDVTNKHVSSGGDTSWYGGVLMLGYLGFDGFTSTFQDKLFKGYHMETYNQMVWVNLCSAAISLFWLLSDSSLTEAFNFIGRHPGVMGDVIILSTAAMLGQLCILYTIREFGALLFATIMTTRQFISILLSCIIFMHPLTLPQWGGTCMVFGALYYNAFLKAARKGSKKEITIVSDDAKSGEKENLISKDGIA